MRRFTQIFLALLVCSEYAVAQSAEAQAEPLRRYAVEVIVFRYTQNVGTGSERFAPPDEPAPLVFSDGTNAVSSPARVDKPRRIRPIERRLLSETEFTMIDIWSHLERLDVYRPVLQFGWTQLVHPKDETADMPLSSLTRAPRGLSGDFKLYLGRYLHLVVDLELAAGDGGFSYDISEDRIFKNGDIRYFDHPKFGVIAKVTRAEAGEDTG